MLLASVRVGLKTSTRTLAFLHGFTQTRSSMLNLIDAITTHVSEILSITVDAPMHGESQLIETDVAGAGDAIVETCGTAIYIGYSMGARICLHAALQHPSKVQGLVLISGTAGIVDHDQRLLRKKSDDELASHIEDVGTKQFISEWLAKPMFALLPEDPEGFKQRCTNSAASLAKSLRLCGTGTQESLWEKLSELKMPVLLLAGAHDEAFCQHARRMKEIIGTYATLQIVSDAGHSVHLEQPEESAAIISQWLKTF